MNIHDYLQILKRGLVFIIVIVLAGAAIGALVGRLTPKTYQVAATVGIFAGGRQSVGDLQQGSVFASQEAATYAALATTDVVLDQAVIDLGDSTTASALRSTISVVVRTNSSLMDVNASGGNPRQLAASANAVATALGGVAPAVTSPGSGTNTVPLEVITVTRAKPPTVAIAPQPRYTTFVGIVVALALAIIAVIARSSLDTRIRTTADIPDPLQFLSRTNILRPAGRRRRLQIEGRLETYRALRGTLQAAGDRNRVIAIAAVKGSGEAAAMAQQFTDVLSETDSTVLVLDADLRERPKTKGPQAASQGSPEYGLADVLMSRVELDAAISRDSESRVHKLSAGNVDDTSASLLSSGPMRNLLDVLKRHYSYVVVTCPPMAVRSESAVLAALADNTLLVMESGRTRRQDLHFALELLDGVKAGPVSAIVNNVREGDLRAVRSRAD